MSFRPTLSRSIAAFSPRRTSLLALALGVSSLISVAHAENYHAVEAGETLQSVAARLGTDAQTIRALNKLTLADNAPLPSMLLCLPDDGNSAPNTRATTSLPAATTAVAGNGSVSRSVRYAVKAGDTMESVAARYGVSVELLREKNNLGENATLQAGQNVVVPLGATTYRSNAQTEAPRTTSARTADGRAAAVQISEQFDWPVAQVVPDAQPVYRSPNAKPQTNRGGSPRDYNRGGLSSRAYMPNPNLSDGRSGSLDGARVLQPNEEAPNSAPNAPRSRVIQAPKQAAATAQRVAKVAKVFSNGARIRRLPDAQAASLYSCPVSTELAVIRTSGMWSAILMSDRSTGWVPTRYLKLTGASVDISSIAMNDTMKSDVRRSTNNKFAMAGNFTSNQPMVATALTWLGTRYVYGGTGRNGIDCSALVQTSFRANGVNLPRTAAEQSKVGQRIDPAQLKAGDRLYFSASGSRVDHTGLYMGDGLFVHASGSGRSVIVSNLYDRRNWNIFVGARR